MKFEERLLEIRKNRGMSQEALAEKIGVSRQAVSKWETGDAQPDYTKLVALADALEVSLDYLCGREPQVENVPSTDTERQEKKQKGWITVVAIIAVLIVGVAGLFAGWQIANREEGIVEPAAPYLPDIVEVSGVVFGRVDKLHTECRFISSIMGEQYDYQIHFKDANGKVISVDARLEGGFYSGIANLPNGTYSVSATVSNGVESRAMLLSGSLEVELTTLTWSEPLVSMSDQSHGTTVVSGINFQCFDGAGVTFQFIPNIIGVQYTYIISFIEPGGNDHSFMVPLDGNVCRGTVDLGSSGEDYTVIIKIRYMADEHSEVVATGLDWNLEEKSIGWMPV